MNREYIEKEVTIVDRVLTYWILESISFKLDLNMGILGFIGYETLDDLKNRELNGVRLSIKINNLTNSQSYSAVRQEALGLVSADPRFIGAALKQYEINS